MSQGFVSQSKLHNELELILATHTCYFIPRTSLFLPFIPHHNMNKYLIIGLYIKKVLSTKNQTMVKKIHWWFQHATKLATKCWAGGLNPLTPMNDQYRISPYNINTISSRWVMRIKKNINLGIISRSNSKFSELTS